MKIVVDENIPMAERCFGHLGEVVKVAGRQIDPAQLRDADALIVRSITQVNQSLLEQSSVRFVGSATIGVDHIDQAYLAKSNVAFANAPGCNARSVVEYVFAALLELEATRDFQLKGKTVGIIGEGNVGSRLRQVCEAMGLDVIACDPPRQNQGVSADEAWQADIVSLHVPYSNTGPHATHHLGDFKRISDMVPGAVLINSSRGSVVDNIALSRALNQRYDLSVVLDVWEGEPFVNRELANQVDIATPHIAGYSYDGKLRGTWMIYQAYCDFLGCQTHVAEADLMDEKFNVELDFASNQAPDPMTARGVLAKIYDIREDDIGLRTSLQLPREKRAYGFDTLRKHYRVRREYQSVVLRSSQHIKAVLGAEQFSRLVALGLIMD
jgi:erythronate-4-phosphate dehydrogenase